MYRPIHRVVRSGAVACALVPAVAGVASAHGPVPVEAPSVGTLLGGWTVEPLVALPLVGAIVVWTWMTRRVNATHPDHPVSRARTVALIGGLAAIAVALLSGIGAYDTSLFWVHMVQHLLLALVAAPLIALSGPITLLLRVSSPETRRRWILPVLHSRVMRVLSFPVVAWVVFGAVMWGTHFSPLFDLALEDPLVHDVEHVFFFGAGLLFWWPAVGRDPTPWRMSPPVRALYVFLQMPQNTFLAFALLSAPQPLYEHYATSVRSWGPDPLLDQQIAAGIMWVGGDLLFLAVVLGLVASWMREDERSQAVADRRAEPGSAPQNG